MNKKDEPCARAGSDGRLPGFGRYVGPGRQEQASLPVFSEYSEGSPELNRIWARLEEELPSAVPRRGLRKRSAVVWSAAASLAAFIGGVWVGQHQSTPASAELLVASMPAAGATVPSETRGARPRSVEQASAPTLLLVESEEETNVQVAPPVVSVSVKKPPRVRTTAAIPAGTSVVEPGVGGGSSLGEPSQLVKELPHKAETEPPRWQRLANRGEYEGALFVLSQAGGFESVLASASSEQLMLLVDVARATGQSQRAIAALRRVVSEFPSEPVAPLAAWSLGNLLDKTGDKRGAAAAFALYSSLSPEGDFAEAALARQIEGEIQRGDSDRALELISRYESEYSEGDSAVEVAAWKQKLLDSARLSLDGGVPLQLEE